MYETLFKEIRKEKMSLVLQFKRIISRDLPVFLREDNNVRRMTPSRHPISLWITTG